jgi:hypothetical protein
MVVGAQGTLYFNGLKHVVRVDLGDSAPTAAIGMGGWSVHQVTMESRMVTLSFYTDTRDLMSIFLWDSGSWTVSITPMVPPSCYTKDLRAGVKDVALAWRRVRAYANKDYY